MKKEFQVKSGKKILSKHKTKAEAGRSLARLLYNHNNLSIVEVRK